MKELNGFTVLAAEDEPVILNNIAKKIERVSPRISVSGKAHSGQEALDLLHDRHFDILVTDIEMPGMSGLELIRRAKEDYLLKPVEQKTLSDLLSALCLQIEEERAARNRDILSLALNDSPDHNAPFMFRDSGFILSLITLGTLPPESTDTSALVPGRSFRKLWQEAGLEECFQSVSSIQHLWLIDERSPQQKFLILHMEDTALSAEFLSMMMKKHLSGHLDGLPFLVLTCCDPISYKDLWTKARFLRSAVRSVNLPFHQEALCVNTEHPVEPPDSASVVRDMKLLISVKSADEFQSCLEASLKELWKTASHHTGSTTLCAKIAQYLEINLREQISLTALAQRFGYTPSYLNRIFKKEYGTSPLQYLTDLRISRAKELLLRHPDISIKTVASNVGYEDSRYFSRIFKNETGMTPSAWTEQEKSGFAGELSCWLNVRKQ